MLNLVILNKISKDQINILSFQIGSKLLNCFKSMFTGDWKVYSVVFYEFSFFGSTLLDWWGKKTTLTTPLAMIMELICCICWLFQYSTQVINSSPECNIPVVLLRWFFSHKDFMNFEVKLICYWHFVSSYVKIWGEKIKKHN